MLGCSHKVLAESLQVMTNYPPNIAIHLTRHRRFTPPMGMLSRRLSAARRLQALAGHERIMLMITRKAF